VDTPRRILVVDDNADLRENLIECLELEGFQAEAAADGQEALDLLGRDRLPHLILIDQMMPGLTGLELAAHIRSERRLDRVRLVLSTGVRPPDSPAHVDEVLLKPFGLEQLLGLLRRVLAA
jgi:CheY-like chemotaxis protein